MTVSSASAGLNVAAVYKQFAANAPALSGDGYQVILDLCDTLILLHTYLSCKC